MSVSSVQKVSLLSGGLALAGIQLNAGSFFGSCLGYLGTTTTGQSRLIVGSFLRTSSDGAFHVLEINESGMVTSGRSYGAEEPLINIEGQRGQLGASCSAIDDLDGNGMIDAVVGAPQLMGGIVFIVTFAINGDLLNVVEISGRPDTGSPPLIGVIPLVAQFGYSLVPIGDLNGDGNVDLAVGARLEANRGAAYIIFLDDSQQVDSFVRFNEDTPNLPLQGLGDSFGSSLSVIQLQDSVELLVGAPTRTGNLLNSGALFLLRLSPNGTILNAQAIGENQFPGAFVSQELFGFSVSPLGDINNDGVADMVVSSQPNNDQRLFITLLEICGDGIVTGTEVCDDNNSLDQDGCNINCIVEPNFICEGSPSICRGFCGDGIVAVGNECDDNNTISGDGCDPGCRVEEGYLCSSQPSVCEASCGDGIVAGDEECDDGNQNDLDGCSNRCLESLSSGELSGIVISTTVVVCCLIAVTIALGVVLHRRSPSPISPSDLLALQSQDIPLLNDIKVGALLGVGHFGNVYKGDWSGTKVGNDTLTRSTSQFFVKQHSSH